MDDIITLQGKLQLANAEIEALRKDKLRLTQELAKVRGMLRAGGADNMSTKLKDALRE
ncbi:hypothetical protein [Paenibacillus sp. OV219]|uniref:hypothetical protein n=1 Tax=Paenibacillus sp. OV219 TaxID=1884377 RepID=UPI0008B43462|nr:hypothetical protein [Paenibacillus sp. OV219]SEO49944.1 hypothetical protein SAMN05518847_10889 [Paenibacillus sp. OV219]